VPGSGDELANRYHPNRARTMNRGIKHIVADDRTGVRDCAREPTGCRPTFIRSV
jgi:hypothetical protein